MYTNRWTPAFRATWRAEGNGTSPENLVNNLCDHVPLFKKGITNFFNETAHDFFLIATW